MDSEISKSMTAGQIRSHNKVINMREKKYKIDSIFFDFWPDIVINS